MWSATRLMMIRILLRMMKIKVKLAQSLFENKNSGDVSDANFIDTNNEKNLVSDD